MAREIKFKYFHSESGDMSPRSWTPTELMEAAIRTNNILTMEDGIWLQFTGLKDKNGVKIYEGDIVMGQERLTRPYSKTAKKKRFPGVVELHIGTGTSEWRVKTEDTGDYRYRFGGDFYNCEVIGNIYENPELLKK
jgi:uncharacterized phage protein (TIGR01671 family)